MGYSIATPIKSEKAKKKMMTFLANNFRDLGTPMRGPLDAGLSYDHGPRRIGFDGTTISDYMISVCAWIALKVGRQAVFPTKKCPNAAGPHKYLVYDGRDIWPLLISQRYRPGLGVFVQVNWVGCLVPEPDSFLCLTYRGRDLLKIDEELKRLDALWNNQP